MGFVDSHVEVVPLQNLWTIYWNAGWQPKNVPPL
jgi:hypothetical protein